VIRIAVFHFRILSLKLSDEVLFFRIKWTACATPFDILLVFLSQDGKAFFDLGGFRGSFFFPRRWSPT